MALVNEIIAIEKGVKARHHSEISDLNKVIQKSDLFNGMARKYDPVSEDGEKLPSEDKKVQLNANEILEYVARIYSDLMMVTARKDWTNQNTKADLFSKGKS